MSKQRTPSFKAILNCANAAYSAQTGSAFMWGIKSGFEELFKQAAAQGSARDKFLSELEEAFESLSGANRRKRILEMCTWPILDKLTLKHEEGEAPEFLWLFATPFVVTLSESEIRKTLLLEGDILEGAQFLNMLTASGWLNANAELGMFPIPLMREDLHAYGPYNLAMLFLSAEEGQDVSLQPLPIKFDPDIESSRVVTLFFICAARMPVGERELIHRRATWQAGDLEKLVTYGLQSSGVSVESVRSCPPCSMAECLLRCTGAGRQELGAILELGRHHYGDREVVLRFPMEGMAELTAQGDRADEEYSLTTPFQFIEPASELQSTLESLCEEKGQKFKGAYSVTCSQSAMLQ